MALSVILKLSYAMSIVVLARRVRLAEKEELESDHLEKLETKSTAEEDFTALIQQTAAEDSESSMCGRSKATKHYRFHVAFLNQNSIDEVPPLLNDPVTPLSKATLKPAIERKVAIELVTVWDEPRLIFHEGGSWGVCPTSGSCSGKRSKMELSYNVTGTERDINILQDVVYVKRIPAGGESDVPGLEIKFEGQEDLFSFVGGMYMGDALMKEVVCNRQGYYDGTPKETAGAEGATGTELQEAKEAREEALKSNMKGTLKATALSVPLGIGIQCMFGSGALIVAGGGLPLAVGVGAVILGTAVDQFRQHRKLKKFLRDANYAASAKIFDKLKCHAKMKKCGENVLVPLNKQCPPW